MSDQQQEQFNELALFAGAGGGILGGKLLGWTTVCAVEIDRYPRDVLLQRQRDGILPVFPIWDDIRTFDGRPWRGLVDVVSGGFPCQDISVAGRGAGIDGERSGLWSEMARVIREVRPRFAFVENSSALTARGLHRVLGDLAEMGFDAEWGVLGADDCGAPHRRKRIWIVAADSNGRGQQYSEKSCTTASKNSEIISNGSAWHVADTNSSQCERGQLPKRAQTQHANACVSSWWQAEPNVGRVADGVAARVDRLKAIGNGQVPAVAATAWGVLLARFKSSSHL